MNLNETISKIKLLMYKNILDYDVITLGEINSESGMKVTIIKTDGTYIGETSIIDFKNGLSLSPNLRDFMNNYSNPFGMNDTVYQFSLLIDEPYRGQGWGEKLKKECHNIIKDHGYKFITNIVKCDNKSSQGLMKKLGYKKHQTNGIRDVLYFEL